MRGARWLPAPGPCLRHNEARANPGIQRDRRILHRRSYDRHRLGRLAPQIQPLPQLRGRRPPRPPQPLPPLHPHPRLRHPRALRLLLPPPQHHLRLHPPPPNLPPRRLQGRHQPPRAPGSRLLGNLRVRRRGVHLRALHPQVQGLHGQVQLPLRPPRLRNAVRHVRLPTVRGGAPRYAAVPGARRHPHRGVVSHAVERTRQGARVDGERRQFEHALCLFTEAGFRQQVLRSARRYDSGAFFEARSG
mmetsp:Transcript_26744/g.67063  ORF Transcript_26744/g.67063 Transcript_26744/m.67063 type:complete len:246 (-) Transcript_26744:1614-2351(-)